jgi:hypothetical protein
MTLKRELSRTETFALHIYKELFKAGKLKRDAGKKAMLELIGDAIDTHVEADLDTSNVSRYNKAELRKDLIIEIKKGKVEAGKLLAELDGMKNNTDEYIVCPINFSELEDIDQEQFVNDVLDREDKKNESN